MSSDASDFGDLIERLQDGDDSAASELFDQFRKPLLRALSRRIPGKLQSRFGASDLAQAVWCSIFQNPEDLSRFETPDELRAFLLKVARNKLFDETRKHAGTQRRDKSREQHLDASLQDAGLTSNNASASQLVQCDDLMSVLRRDLPVRDQQMVEERRNGATIQELAEKYKLNERTIRRVFERLERKING